MPKQLSAKTYLLTYSQSSFDFENDLHSYQQHLSNLGTVSYSCVCREKHADGGDHWHVLVDFDSKLRATPRCFDWKGVHPNIAAVGRTRADYDRAWKYVRKDGDFRESGTRRYAKFSVWTQVATATTRDAALQIVREQQPRDYIINRRQIDYALDQLFPASGRQPYVGRELSDFKRHDGLEHWISGSYLYEHSS